MMKKPPIYIETPTLPLTYSKASISIGGQTFRDFVIVEEDAEPFQRITRLEFVHDLEMFHLPIDGKVRASGTFEVKLEPGPGHDDLFAWLQELVSTPRKHRATCTYRGETRDFEAWTVKGLTRRARRFMREVNTRRPYGPDPSPGVNVVDWPHPRVIESDPAYGGAPSLVFDGE